MNGTRVLRLALSRFCAGHRGVSESFNQESGAGPSDVLSIEVQREGTVAGEDLAGLSRWVSCRSLRFSVRRGGE